MICPACQSEQPLTWRRYFTDIWGRHICTVCHRKFKVPLSFWYSVFILFLNVVIMRLAFLVTCHVWRGFTLMFIPVGIVIALIIEFPLDKWMDDKHRTLKLIKSQTEQPPRNK